MESQSVYASHKLYLPQHTGRRDATPTWQSEYVYKSRTRESQSVYASHKLYLQPIPPVMTFSKALSKVTSEISNISFATFQWKETFELWALTFERAFKKSHRRWDRLYLLFRGEEETPTWRSENVYESRTMDIESRLCIWVTKWMYLSGEEKEMWLWCCYHSKVSIIHQQHSHLSEKVACRNMNIYIYIYIHMYIYTYIHICSKVHTLVYIYIYTHTHIYVYI